MLRAGIIGLGVGAQHALALQELDYCRVLALCDFSEEKLQKLAQMYPDARLTTNASAVLEDPSIDLVSIASYDDYHYDQVIRGIESGKHIFVEKPMCLHPFEARGIRDRLQANPSIHLSSNLVLRSAPRFLSLKSSIQNGEMGEIYHLEGDYLWGRREKLENGWRRDMEFYSIIHGAAVHLIDLIMWLTEKRPVEVFSYGNNLCAAGGRLCHNDFALIVMKFENGLTAKVGAHGSCVHPHFHAVKVYGSKRTFINEMAGGRWIEACDQAGHIEESVEDYPAKNRRGEVIASFVRSMVDQGIEPIVPCEDVFAVMSVCFAAERSAREQNPIKVEYI